MPFFLFTINDYQDRVSSVRTPARGLRFDTRWPWAHRSSDNDRLAECCSTNKHKDSTIVSPTCERHVQLIRVSFRPSRAVSLENTLDDRPCLLVFLAFLLGMSTRSGAFNLTNSQRATTLQQQAPSMNPDWAQLGSIPRSDSSNAYAWYDMLQSTSCSTRIVVAGGVLAVGLLTCADITVSASTIAYP
jgi:hypothetical protein